jgi:hypothetical protein
MALCLSRKSGSILAFVFYFLESSASQHQAPLARLSIQLFSGGRPIRGEIAESTGGITLLVLAPPNASRGSLVTINFFGCKLLRIMPDFSRRCFSFIIIVSS